MEEPIPNSNPKNTLSEVEKEEVMTDDQATPLHWFMLEVFTKMILGDQHEITRNAPSKKLEKKRIGRDCLDTCSTPVTSTANS